MSDLPFGKPPKREKKTKKPIRQKSLKHDKPKDSALSTMKSLFTFGKPQKEVKEKKWSSITQSSKTPIKRSPLKKTFPAKSSSKVEDSPLSDLKKSSPFNVDARVVDRNAMDECRALPCVISGKSNPKNREELKEIHPLNHVDPCHVGTRGAGNPDVWWGMIPMQRKYHQEQGQQGWAHMAQKYPQVAEALKDRGWYWDSSGKLWNDRNNKNTA